MSACKIISHQGGGLYVVELLYSTTNRDTRLQELNDWLTDTDNIAQRDALEAAAVALAGEVDAYVTQLNIEIVTLTGLQEGTSAYLQQLQVVTEVNQAGLLRRKDYDVAHRKYMDIQSEFDAKTIEKLEIVRIGTISGERREVWCADLADGQNGRGIYAADQVVPLWCLNYDATQFILPPVDSTVTSLGNDGRFNVMRNLEPNAQPLATYWNVAMEPGFARWQPLFMAGVLQGTSLEDCRSPGTLAVEFPVKLSRFKQPLLSGTFPINSVNYYGKAAFRQGDDVVCQVTYPATENESPTVNLIGFAHDPRSEFKNALTGYFLMQQDTSASADWDVPIANSDIVLPEPTYSESGGVPFGSIKADTTPTLPIEGEGVTKLTDHGYSISGSLNNSFSVSWYARRSDVVYTVYYDIESTTPSKTYHYKFAVISEYWYEYGVKNRRGDWLTTRFVVPAHAETKEAGDIITQSQTSYYRDQLKVNGDYGFTEQFKAVVSKKISASQANSPEFTGQDVFRTIVTRSSQACDIVNEDSATLTGPIHTINSPRNAFIDYTSGQFIDYWAIPFFYPLYSEPGTDMF